METKIRHIRKFIQNVQTPQSRHIESHTTTHTLNPETIPFVPTHNIANPHNAQSFENPSVQASHTFNTQQRPTYGKEIVTSNNNTLSISTFAVEYNLERHRKLESVGYSKEIDKDDDACIKAYHGRSIELCARGNKDYAMLPGKQDVDDLSTNLTVMKRRTENVTTRLAQIPDMFKGDIIQEQKGRGFRKKVTEITETSRKDNPDHPVHRKSSITRIRIVNNCRKRKRWKSEYHMSLRKFYGTTGNNEQFSTKLTENSVKK
ncbi:Hypothetical predicted protein [Mytilus galloprovincialis]|uniref:Uncharacterized protein n=1 Tax=Mytilus galloprovincialis TaxID=29158 RepID=A0A8B6H2L8_MYTGA|nr:Hypothetical predicted protein [Mytilus galloprovincialis]